MKIYLVLLSVSLFVVVSANLGGNRPVGDNDQNVDKAREMTQLKIQVYYPGAQVLEKGFNARKQVVNGIRYNLKFNASWDARQYNRGKVTLSCTAAVVQKPGKSSLEFILENGKKDYITCQ